MLACTQLQCKEVILEDPDIPKAIVSFLAEHYVDKLVIGASSRNAFMRCRDLIHPQNHDTYLLLMLDQDIKVMLQLILVFFIRTLKSDVSTSVSKAAPDFCSVYVISKGRISSIRPASNPNKHPTRPHYFETSGNQFQSIKSG